MRLLCKSRQMVGDLIFRLMVKLHPPEALRKFRKDTKLIQESELFDSAWYFKKYKNHIRLTQSAFHHYLSEGAALGFNPSASFNTQGYLDLYPDVAASKINPLLHYLRSGKREKRSPNVASCADVVSEIMRHNASQFTRLDSSKKTVLLVTHEMSRTGAPILLQNIGKQFRKKYNVIILTLNKGVLENEFAKACDALIGSTIPPEYLHSERFFMQLFERIEFEHHMEFAVVSTLLSHVVLKPLWGNNIPSIHLIHEFASNTRPRTLLRQSVLYSSQQIFSASLVRENAILDCPEIHTGNSIVVPQGINSAPGTTNAPEQAEAEKQRIRDIFRPAGFPKDTVVIVGMGTVHMRKGVDLFITCAKRVVEKHSATPFRFVWIGHGYDPERNEYSFYLEDQIRRSGLNDIVSITEEVAEIETAYQESDVLFLSSRLDPLPLVSQDSMANGKPVVCFEGATGIAEYLAEDADAAFGVVPYMDVDEAANRICQLIDDDCHRKQVGEACRKLAAARFSFDSYVNRLEEIGLDMVARKQNAQVK